MYVPRAGIRDYFNAIQKRESYNCVYRDKLEFKNLYASLMLTRASLSTLFGLIFKKFKNKGRKRERKKPGERERERKTQTHSSDYVSAIEQKLRGKTEFSANTGRESQHQQDSRFAYRKTNVHKKHVK